MKVYVDELPKSCDECALMKVYKETDAWGNEHIYHECQVGGSSLLIASCPLESINKYKKQVREQVCDEIYNKCEPLFRLVNNYDNGDVIERNELVDILDQIQELEKE